MPQNYGRQAVDRELRETIDSKWAKPEPTDADKRRIEDAEFKRARKAAKRKGLTQPT